MLRLHPATVISIVLAVALSLFYINRASSIKDSLGLNDRLVAAVLQGDATTVERLLTHGATLGFRSNSAHSSVNTPRSLLFDLAVNSQHDVINLLLAEFPDRQWDQHLAIKKLALHSWGNSLFEVLMKHRWEFESVVITDWLINATEYQVKHRLPQLMVQNNDVKAAITAAIFKASVQADLPRLKLLKELAPSIFSAYASGACCHRRAFYERKDNGQAQPKLEIAWPIDLQLGIAHAAAMHPKGLAVLQWLKENNQPLDEADASGKTPLMWAALAKEQANFLWLIADGADIQKRDVHGQNVLMFSLAPQFMINWPRKKASISRLAYATDHQRIAARLSPFFDREQQRPQLSSFQHRLTNATQYENLLKFGIDPTSVDSNGASAFDFDASARMYNKSSKPSLRAVWEAQNL